VELPKTPGTYILFLSLEVPITTQIGRLGVFTVNPGLYAYVGSAFGPGGLRARLNRHLRHDKKTHWHIDYLTTSAPIVTLWLMESSERYECQWAQQIASTPDITIPIPDFGSSDCGCSSHLFAVPSTATLKLDQPVVIFDQFT
jgi:Uri superfamily endonuclease